MNTTTSIPLFLVGLLFAGTAWAQEPTAQDYFNRAAHQYVKQDKVSALRTLDRALQEHPGDARLLKLAEELLKEDMPQQQQQEQQQENNEQQDGSEGQQEQQGGQDQREEQEQADNNAGQRAEERPQEGGKPLPERISPQDAQRLLDAMDRQEKDVQDKVRTKQRPPQRTPIDKDW